VEEEQLKEEEEQKEKEEDTEPTEDLKEGDSQGDKKPDAVIKWETIFDSIIGDLRYYASKMGEPDLDDRRLKDYLADEAIKYIAEEDLENSPLVWQFMEGLEKGSKELRANVEDISKFGVEDSRRISSRDFIQWYVATFRNQVALEIERIEKEQGQVARGYGSLLENAIITGAAFGAFLLSTMLLVVFRIESNTRKN